MSSPTKPVVVSSSQFNQFSGGNSGSSNIVVETGATRGVKRGADIDFEAFNDAKRRKTNEKGGKGN